MIQMLANKDPTEHIRIEYIDNIIYQAIENISQVTSDNIIVLFQ
jgi:hypothetical protein